MNTIFTLAWFEDDDGWYKITEDEVKANLINRNFKPDIVRFKSVDVENINKECATKSFDLILADLGLLDGENSGAKAIVTMREKHILADALFYSSKGVDGLEKAMQSEILEGVYRVNRNGPLFKIKLDSLINKIVKRSENIINIRGLLMDTVSEFDAKLRETIQKYFSICNEDERNYINEYAYSKVVEQAKRIKKKCEEIKGDGFYLSANDLHYIDSYKLSMIINKIFEEKYAECIEMKGFHENYKSIILEERNRLAHAKKEPESSGVFYFENKQGERTEYDSVKCSEIRASINRYDELISRIIEYIH